MLEIKNLMKFFWLLQFLIFHSVIPYITLICPTIFSKVSPAYLCPTYVQLMSSLCPAYVQLMSETGHYLPIYIALMAHLQLEVS